ncbi:MAG: patatin-like phospholipase family protein [Microcystis aeruginosa Ma_QC_Ca_00000000_S207]|uniref:Patatin-like phospholipase family protein n=1 Tax=Microcystis aeruginosa Ma_QC_Ca_00000000_S207 TaxID=2486251 RepID=A0A552FAB1_MICAE|nr:MAG: patatin-like phospholipase family protein [Microcystis aeruginosa Ma_QC_Ca_00000000_S207]
MNTTNSKQKLNYIRQIIIGIGIIAIAVVVWWHIPDSFWKYLFFLRAPILWGLLLVTLPLIATLWLPAMLRNLFVLRGPWQLISVIVSANMAAIGVIINAYMLLKGAPDRFGLSPWLEISDIWQYGLAIAAIALSLPICVTSYKLSKEEIKENNPIQKVIFSVFLSLVLLFAVIQTKTWIFTNFANNKLLISFVEFITRHKTEGYILGTQPKPQQFLEGHLSNIAFFIVAFIVYGIIGLIFQPQSEPSDKKDEKDEKKEAAALMYVMLILMMIAPLSGSLTFYFDYYRVPVFLLFVVIVALMYALFKVDHFFELNLNEANNHDPNDFKTAIEKRLEYQGKEKTLVVVCASGGGIQAAGWTVQVLTGLQDMLGNSFTQSIGFISSVSGGSVGTMYYLDRFDPDKGYPESKDFENIFKSATEDSLDAVGWGLAYPDLWRIIGLPFLAPKMCDRGKVIETDWQRELKYPKNKQHLSDWKKQINKGEIPIPIFNATLVEDGRRFLISPMTFDEECKDKNVNVVDFNTLYPGKDMDIVTAARLSATFSYVSPISRYVGENPQGNYHIADGGYFDNSGVVTMVEWLNEWLDPQKGLNIKRVLLLQINAFPESTPSKSNIEGGWWQAIIGPLLTLFSVRDTTQLSRVSTEVELLQQRWENQVKIAYCPIFFPKNGKNGEYKPPLSWTLTKKQKQNIKNGWCGIKKEIGKQIGEQIGEEWKKWGFEDPSPKSTNEK